MTGKSNKDESEVREMKEEIKKKREEKELKNEDTKNSSQEEELKKELDNVKEDYLRLRADFENFRRRKEEELLQTRERALISFITELLPIIDNFEMSLKMKEHTEMFVKGTEMLHRSLLEKLKENQIQAFEVELNETFNPLEHEPVPSDKEGEEGKVLGVLSKGYKHKDKVIRPARVEVKKGEE